jgi:hypothetical protein
MNNHEKEILKWLNKGLKMTKKCHFEQRGELRGYLTTEGEGNPQPSRSNVISYVDRMAQRLTGEDSQADKPDTSAPDTVIAGVMR